MSKRLQVLIPGSLDAVVQKAAKRARISKGEWVRRAIELALRQEREGPRGGAVDRLAALEAPTADIEQMIEQTEAGRGKGVATVEPDARR